MTTKQELLNLVQNDYELQIELQRALSIDDLELDLKLFEEKVLKRLNSIKYQLKSIKGHNEALRKLLCEKQGIKTK